MVSHINHYKGRPIKMIELPEREGMQTHFYQVGQYVYGQEKFDHEGGDTFATLEEVYAYIDTAE